MIKKPREIWGVAYHEAGHAVIGRINGIRLKSISIEPHELSLGRVLSKNLLANKSPDSVASFANRMRMEKEVQMILAGVVAERKFERNHSYRKLNPHSADNDYQSAINLISYFCGSDAATGAYFRLLLEQTRLLVGDQDSWKAIKELAALLVTKKVVYAKEVSQWFKEYHPGL